MDIGVLVVPRDQNPYQEGLYSELTRLGFRVRYGAELTRSRTLNLLAFPLEMAWARSRGFRILHIHWTFGFLLGGGRGSVSRRLSRWWFELVLEAARRLGMHIVWTAHNLLPHDPVFDDDRSARRVLVRRADLVIAHSNATLDAIAATFSPPRRGVVIDHGPLAPAAVTALRGPTPTEPRNVLFIGRVAAYKGVEDLVAAAVAARSGAVRVRVVGACADPALAARLRAAAANSQAVTLDLGYAPDEQLTSALAWADVVAYPFRTVTTSGSVTLAIAAGRGMIVPDLPAFADLPDGAVIRYTPGRVGLNDALESLAGMPSEMIEAMGLIARSSGMNTSWAEIAQETAVQFLALLPERAAGATRLPLDSR